MMVFCENNYNIGFQPNAEITYEYSYINITLLIQLAIEDYSYSGYYSIPQGFQIKWVVGSIVERSNYWIVSANVYRGESFTENAGSFETFVYKNPEDLSFELFNGTGNELYFIPPNVTEYLSLVNQSIPAPDRTYSFAFNNSIVFDHTQLSSNDTIRYEYNLHGIMTSYQIFYNHSLAFTLELKTFSLGGFDPLLLTVIISISTSTALITTYIILKKRKLKKAKNRKRFKTKKLLRKIK
ncbi:MAG: hypothetical protein ACTSRT_17810 [Promethearchaeota archaeon]